MNPRCLDRPRPSLVLFAAVAACQPAGRPRPVEVSPARPSAVAADAQPVDGEIPPALLAPKDGPLVISRSRCAGADCELVFTFSHEMVEASELATAAPVTIEFTPAKRGALHWISPQQLRFTPQPGELGWGHEVDIQIASAVPLAGPAHALREPFQDSLQVPYFVVAGKVAGWPVEPGKPRFVAFLDGGSDDIGAGGALLLFDQPVEPGAIARHVSMRGPRGRIAVTVSRPSSIERVWSDPVDLAPIVAVTTRHLPADGGQVTLRYPEAFAGRAATAETRTFTVKRSLRVLEIGVDGQDGKRAPLAAVWRVNLSSPIGDAQLSRRVTISPEPRQHSAHAYGEEIAVSAQLDPGKTYELVLSADLTDSLGNRLGKPIKHTVTAHDLEPSLSVPDAVVLEAARRRLPVRGVNVRRAVADVHTFADAAGFVRAVASGSAACSPAAGARPRRTSLAMTRPINQVETRELTLPAGAGLLCVAVTAQGHGSRARQVARSTLVQVTDLAVVSKVHRGGIAVWVTRLSDATPAAGAAVSLLDSAGDEIARATTGADGLASLAAPAIGRGDLDERYYVVARSKQDAAVGELSSGKLAQPWQFGLRGDVADVEPLAASVFTDRGVYRPDETVHVAVIAREREAGRLRRPEQGAVAIDVTDPRGKQVLTGPAPLDAFGVATADVALGKQAAVGRYSVTVTLGDRVANHSFLVEEYRVPTFEVALDSDQSDWPTDRDARVAVRAAYLHGGKLAARSVALSVKREPAPFAPPGLAQYLFRAPYRDAPAGEIKSVSTRLDGQGRFALSFRPGHPAVAGPMRYIVEASVTDVDRQVLAGRLARIVHPTGFYLGVRPPPANVLAAGDTIAVPVVAVTPAGRRAGKLDVGVRLESIRHHTTGRLSGDGVERDNRRVIEVVSRCRVKTRAGAGSCRLRIPRAGQYRVVATAVDAARRPVETGYEISVTGDTPIAWPRFDHERIELIADRDRYQAGDTARILVQSPFETARGLLTLEQDGVLSHRLFRIDRDARAIEVPIAAIHAPNVYASVVLLRGRVHDQRDATGFETGAPAFRIGQIELPVTPAEARVSVAVSADAPTARPGATVKLSLQAKDAEGKPVTGRAVVMVVDEAVLGLTAHRTPDPLAGLYAPVALGVRTAASQLELPTSRRERREPLFPGGDGGEGEEAAEEGNGPGRPPVPARSLFHSTALFDPRVALDAAGRATVTVTLPDSVTSFRAMAVVVDAGGRAGSGDARLVVRKPVMVTPAAPRFVHPGDRLEIEAVVFNGSDRPGTAQVSARFGGMTLDGEPSRPIDVAAGATAKVAFPVTVTGTGKAVIELRAALGPDTDAIKLEIPILDPGAHRSLVASAKVSGSERLALTLPPDRVPGSEQLEVVVSTTMLSELAGAVDYIMDYPNGCIEQTTSTAYPLIVLRDLLPEMGVTVDPVKLDQYARAGIERLLSFQTTSGGLAYWPGEDTPHAYGTAFGLTALIEAKRRGYDVPEAALSRMADYLEESLRSGAISEEMPHGSIPDADTRALFAMTLGRLGRPQPAYVSALWRDKDKLTAFGLGFLATAVHEGSGEKALLEPILAEIRRRTVEKPQEAYFEGDPDGGWSMGSPLRTHAGALLAYAGAAPESDLAPKLLSGLLARRVDGLWGNTQENVFGIMGVAAAVGSRRGGKAPQVDVGVNGKRVDLRTAEQMSPRARRIVRTAGTLAGKRGEPATQVVTVGNKSATGAFVTVRASFDVALTPANRKPRASGFRVARRAETVDGKALGATIPLGSLVRVRLTVVADGKQNYVAITDRLPAGLEALNVNLATTESIDRGALRPAEARGLAALSYGEIRDSRVAFYTDELPAGEYEFTYLARATTPGRFLRPAAAAEAMYQPDVSGSSAIDSVDVVRPK